MSSSIDWVGLTQNANVTKQIEEGKALAKSGNILAALALIMGAMAQGKIDNITSLAEKIDGGKKADGTAGPNETTLNAAMQTEIQLMSMIISSMSNSLKTYGESVRELARK